MQSERYSMGYFVWPRYSDVIQGPQKKYPGITFARFMDVKSKGFGYVPSRTPSCWACPLSSRALLLPRQATSLFREEPLYLY